MVTCELHAAGATGTDRAITAPREPRADLRDSCWHSSTGNTQVVPASWGRESTTTYSSATRIRQGYRYMWWTLPEDIWGKNAFYASGYGGQIIAVVPAKRLVVVQTVDLSQNPKGIRTSAFLDLLKAIASASR